MSVLVSQINKALIDKVRKEHQTATFESIEMLSKKLVPVYITPAEQPSEMAVKNEQLSSYAANYIKTTSVYVEDC